MTPMATDSAHATKSYNTDPGEEPDPMKWVTEVAIHVADR
jgi:hypothetical protein